MNINIAKNIIYKNIGIKRKFFYKGPRNQNEIFEGFIGSGNKYSTSLEKYNTLTVENNVLSLNVQLI